MDNQQLILNTLTQQLQAKDKQIEILLATNAELVNHIKMLVDEKEGLQRRKAALPAENRTSAAGKKRKAETPANVAKLSAPSSPAAAPPSPAPKAQGNGNASKKQKTASAPPPLAEEDSRAQVSGAVQSVPPQQSAQETQSAASKKRKRKQKQQQQNNGEESNQASQQASASATNPAAQGGKKKAKQQEKPAEQAKQSQQPAKKKKKAPEPTPLELPANEKSIRKQSKSKTGGLAWVDTVVGTGAAATLGKRLTVTYKGYLRDGSMFDESRADGFTFRLGFNEVIKGWDKGLLGMRVGGKRKLVVPPQFGYGFKNIPKIPPNSTLCFDIELLSVA